MSYMNCLNCSFSHGEQGSQVCRPTSLMPPPPHMLSGAGIKANWISNQSQRDVTLNIFV